MNKIFSLLFLLVLLFSGCSENQTPEQEVGDRADKAYRIFLEAKSVEDIDRKIRLLSMAASHINAPHDTLLTEILDHQIYYYDTKKAYDSSLHYANRMIELARETGDTATLAKGFYRRGRLHLYQGDHLNVLKDMHESQKYYLLAGDSISAGKRLVELGIAQYRLGDFSGSQARQIQALRLLKGSKDSIYLSRIYNNLAMTYKQLKDFNEAIDEYSTALNFVPTRKDSLSVLYNIANLYTEKEEYTKALQIYDSIIPLTTEKTLLNRIKNNYYFTLWLEGEANVEDSLKQIMVLRQDENDLEGLLSSYDHLVRINQKEEPQEALQFARQHYELSNRLKSVTDQMVALQSLVRLSPPGDDRQYALEYMRINDSIVTARNRVKNLFAKIEYDEEQKLREINELEILANTQKLELLQERNRRNMAVSTALLLLISALFIYYFLRQRHKRKTIREIHQTEVRISKRIHDELANDVYNVITEIENPVNLNKEVVLNKLESIYSRTRNISRENTPVDTGPGFAEDLQYMLSHSTPTHARLFLSGFQEISWEKINSEAKIVIFRSLQELMVNMNKHSKASIIGLNFRRTGSKLQISYTDNGIGISSENIKKGSGLQNVENRIVSIDGAFNFQSDKENGFSANILIPV